MKKKYNVKATVGEYKDSDGEIKKLYSTVGVFYENEDGTKSIRIDTLPVGNYWNQWLNVYPVEYKKEVVQPSPQPQQGYQPSPQTQPPQPQAQQSYQATDQNDDIPF
jgi:hypothetical protein|tara:strand:+ start:121 stop:441 length:321 start_codon:yes stop_codon:yes gene_type:complete